ncbi:hypothetical protein F5I97DRAFT_1903328 [Phlebopus sp. FC_14]|nr:hypothetical protein F5I97DRAFT_1903328 [Phlebopus sp. FC_14]
MPKRSVSLKVDSDEASDSDRGGRSKRLRSSSPWNVATRETPAAGQPLKVHILPAKLDSLTFTKLVSLVDGKVGAESRHVGLEHSGDPQQADVIVTAVRMRPRLERHMDWKLAKAKAIVTPDWLINSVQSGTLLPCGDYTALHELHEETAEQCPGKSGNVMAATEIPESFDVNEPLPQSEDTEALPNPADVAALQNTSRYCCQRSSPLVCPNQDLVRELDIVRRCRSLEGEERSMLSYSRAIATIKAYPHKITEQRLRGDVAKLPFLGEKLLSMTKEYLKTGRISEAQNILSSSRFQSLSAFTSVHGIGPHTARRLYNLGLRTIEDLEKYYEVTPGMTGEETLALLNVGKNVSEDTATEISIKVALALRHEFNEKISREEVEEINRIVMRELAELQKGCKSVIVGGYRRGKQESNDVDIVISHSDWVFGSQQGKGLCKRLVQRLYERGFVTHVMHLSGFHEHNALRTHHWDSLEKALTVFTLPRGPGQTRVHRRLDLIFAAPGVFWTAVVGWTGSTMFQRDLRLWAKQQK